MGAKYTKVAEPSPTQTFTFSRPRRQLVFPTAWYLDEWPYFLYEVDVVITYPDGTSASHTGLAKEECGRLCYEVKKSKKTASVTIHPKLVDNRPQVLPGGISFELKDRSGELADKLIKHGLLLKCDSEQRAWLLCDLLFAPRIDKPYSIITQKCSFLPLKVDDRGITSGTFTLPLRDVLEVGLGEGPTIYVVLRSGKTHSFYVENREVMEKTIRGFLTSPRHIFEQVREAYLGLAGITLPGGQTIPDDMIRYILKLSYGTEDGI